MSKMQCFMPTEGIASGGLFEEFLYCTIEKHIDDAMAGISGAISCVSVTHGPTDFLDYRRAFVFSASDFDHTISRCK